MLIKSKECSRRRRRRMKTSADLARNRPAEDPRRAPPASEFEFELERERVREGFAPSASSSPCCRAASCAAVTPHVLGLKTCRSRSSYLVDIEDIILDAAPALLAALDSLAFTLALTLTSRSSMPSIAPQLRQRSLSSEVRRV